MPPVDADGGTGPERLDAGAPAEDAFSAIDAAHESDAARSPDGAVSNDAGADAPSTGGPGAACLAALAPTRFDFESGAAGWTHDAIDGFAGDQSWPYDVWDVGVATSGPACHGGTKCAATNLTGNYVQCGRAALRSPAMDLTACAAATDVTLAFQHAFAFWTGSYLGTSYSDGGLVEISNDGGTTWTAVSGVTYPGTLAINPRRGIYACSMPPAFSASGKPGYVGAGSGWQKVDVPIPPAFRTSKFAIRFVYSSGVSSSTSDPVASEAGTAPGWHVDDVAITAK